MLNQHFHAFVDVGKIHRKIRMSEVASIWKPQKLRELWDIREKDRHIMIQNQPDFEF